MCINSKASLFTSEKVQQLKAHRYTLDLPVLILSYVLIVLSWSVSFGLDWMMAVFMLLPLLPILILLSLLMDLLLVWQRIRLWPIQMSWRGMVVYIAVVVSLIAAGPAYAYSYGIRISHNFIKEFDLDVEVDKRDVVLIRQPRSVTTVYNVHDPVAEAKTRLRSRLQNEPGWLLSRDTYFLGFLRSRYPEPVQQVHHNVFCQRRGSACCNSLRGSRLLSPELNHSE